MKQYIKKSEGFTLIEMMVVIAVVGILSAAVLAGLGPSRNKAKDARIVSGVQQARAIAETYYDPFQGGYPAEPSSDPAYAKLESEINKLNGGTAGLLYTASGDNFAISATLASGKSYCVDSAGTVNDKASSGGSCGGAVDDAAARAAAAAAKAAADKAAAEAAVDCSSFKTLSACPAATCDWDASVDPNRCVPR